ncbi:unnamed protein product [Brassica oleracea var. botrytis]|uniref:Uncharacterized protein n=1 Tax=Brassica oleracea TaxID=3712 RepID=A0A3P6B3N6_BRAOL|nr:unnamed protein product [Brassica oleracea]
MQMFDFGLRITVSSLKIVVERLYRRCQFEKSRKLFSCKGIIKPEAYTYNTIINAYVKRETSLV